MHTHTPDLSVFPFDARGVAKRFRHAAIFGALESLNHGERMRFINDHDPLPLLSQIEQRYGGQVLINYIERSPQQVVIDFTIHVADSEPAPAPAQQQGGCGGGGGCGCSGG
ncbi:DUF2249 domain-containing protein [Vogesella fluminis]|uniref:DUF2249 domain-containing protein n=1 Tax=Vogesella fluminis TaxID=1069161 RepID=A0ABQ3H8M4_9NEIS|nr:DUF2249 domain-containing protein [Vogesella fluminis]GHD76145.1 hypothetical protein GCM10011419_15100 [Vogesella fluminis]